MARLTLNVAKEYNENLIGQVIDVKNYMQLGKDSCNRKELLFFAAALGYKSGEPLPFKSAKVSFARTENFNINLPLLYGSLYYEHKVAQGEGTIEEIVDEDNVYNLLEEFANKGFSMLDDEIQMGTPDQTLMNDLIGEMKDTYEDFIDFCEANSISIEDI